MVKTLIKIAIALLVVHAAVRVGTAFWNYYRYEDALQQLAQFGERRSDRQLCDEAVDTAATYGLPLAPAAITIFRGNNPPYTCDGAGGAPTPTVLQPNSQIRIEGRYVDQIPILPGYLYPWEFKPSAKAWLRL
jgi:hypothetical protein